MLHVGRLPQVILKDLDDCEAHIMALENLVSSSATNRNQFDKLSAEWKSLYKAVQVRPWWRCRPSDELRKPMMTLFNGFFMQSRVDVITTREVRNGDVIHVNASESIAIYDLQLSHFHPKLFSDFQMHACH